MSIRDEQILAAFALNFLPPDEWDAVAADLAGCEESQQFAEDIRLLDSLLLEMGALDPLRASPVAPRPACSNELVLVVRPSHGSNGKYSPALLSRTGRTGGSRPRPGPCLTA